MEKTTTRIIGYDKKAHATASLTPKKQLAISTAEVAIKTLPEKANLLNWLKSHDLIKIRTLCEKAGVDPGNFHRWLNVKKEIPQDAIKKISPFLKDYGFNDTL
jgi:hypothetical protein